MGGKVKLNFYISDRERGELNQACQQSGMTTSAFIRKAIQTQRLLDATGVDILDLIRQVADNDGK